MLACEDRFLTFEFKDDFLLYNWFNIFGKHVGPHCSLLWCSFVFVLSSNTV
jgi:hypothetical protein